MNGFPPSLLAFLGRLRLVLLLALLAIEWFLAVETVTSDKSS
jgi:hypothetical protein